MARWGRFSPVCPPLDVRGSAHTLEAGMVRGRRRSLVGAVCAVLATLSVATGGLLIGASAASAAGGSTLVSISTTESGGSVVAPGTVLRVTFNEAAGAGGLLQPDADRRVARRHAQHAAGNLSAAVSGTTSVSFTVHGATSLSLSVLEILGGDRRQRRLRQRVESGRQRAGRHASSELRQHRRLHPRVPRLQLPDRGSRSRRTSTTSSRCRRPICRDRRTTMRPR